MQTAIPLEIRSLSHRFAAAQALDGVNWSLPRGCVAGLVGANGSGKTTLLRCVVGWLAPSAGTCQTLGVPALQLGAKELSRIGYVDQETELLDWLTVRQHIRYVASFQPRWDRSLEEQLVRSLELSLGRRVADLSVGMRQRLAFLLAVCHRPELIVLDEPVSALDPLARREVLARILERALEDGATVIVSSHALHDVEKLVDRVLCLDRGRVVEDASLDELKDEYAEWIVHARGSKLLAAYSEPFVLECLVQGSQARLSVRAGEAERISFQSRHGVEVERRPLDLERIFPLMMGRTAGKAQVGERP